MTLASLFSLPLTVSKDQIWLGVSSYEWAVLAVLVSAITVACSFNVLRSQGSQSVKSQDLSSKAMSTTKVPPADGQVRVSKIWIHPIKVRAFVVSMIGARSRTNPAFLATPFRAVEAFLFRVRATPQKV